MRFNAVPFDSRLKSPTDCLVLCMEKFLITYLSICLCRLTLEKFKFIRRKIFFSRRVYSCSRSIHSTVAASESMCMLNSQVLRRVYQMIVGNAPQRISCEMRGKKGMKV